MQRYLGRLPAWCLWLVAAWVATALDVGHGSPPGTGGPMEPDRSPVDVAVFADGKWLVTANQTSHSVSLVDFDLGRPVQELPVGQRPEAVVVLPDGFQAVVSCSWSGTIEHLRLSQGRLQQVRSIYVGYWPVGLAMAADMSVLYVALSGGDAVGVVDWQTGTLLERIPTGRWPRYLALTPDGRRLAVGVSGDRGVTVIDTGARRVEFTSRFGALNVGHMQVDREGRFVYFPWMTYRRTPITPDNIRLGWVIGSRVARLSMGERQPRQAMPLDVPGQAVADPFGLAITSDERWMVVSAGGTHELLIIKLPDLPLSDAASGNHLPGSLRGDAKRFARVALGGRPLGLRIGQDDRTVFVANYLRNSVQVVDLEAQQLVKEIFLGGPQTPSLARRGEEIFYDARRSLDQWYSCHTCHYEGGTNAEPMDTHNDGTINTYKTVLPLYRVAQTGPWTWHGWQQDLRAALTKSLTSTMQGPAPSEDELDALMAYLQGLQVPPNPRAASSGDSEAVRRGKALFESSRAGCSQCHSGPLYTDGQLHDVGTGSPSDRYPTFNTPSLAGVHARVRLLHDGRATSLEQLLRQWHAPQHVAGQELTDDELADLIAFLCTL